MSKRLLLLTTLIFYEERAQFPSVFGFHFTTEDEAKLAAAEGSLGYSPC